MARVLVTGSEGLLGRAVVRRLQGAGHEVTRLDLRAADAASRGDVRDAGRVGQAVEDQEGVVHLAAVSRVVWGEQSPGVCRETNVTALSGLLKAAAASRARPWVLFASSREVYGQAAVLPATEDTPLAPLNVYGRTKVAGEGLLAEAGAAGLATASVRLSNVFGDPLDHPDRVVPAFLRAAAAGAALRVDGPACSFDFTYLDDVVTALLTVTELLARERRSLPPVHLVTGVPTTLGELAALALRVTRSQAPIESLSSRPFDVARFHGDPGRARALLGWTAETPLEEGLARLAAALGPRSP